MLRPAFLPDPFAARDAHALPTPNAAALAEAVKDTIGAAQDVLTCVTLALLYIAETPDKAHLYADSAAAAANLAGELLSEAWAAADRIANFKG